MFKSPFFLSLSHPINLSIFRIIFALSLFFQISWEVIFFYSTLPHELLFPPVGLGWIVPYLPISPEIAVWIAYAYFFFCFTLLIGFYSRLSALLTAVTAFYIFGIQTFFGSVSHSHHHIVMFCLVLAVCPCGDFLSIDSLIVRNQSAKHQTPALAILWIMMGLIYFYPGFWKLYTSGLDWALSDNVMFHLYSKWSWNEWIPFFRVDHYPILYRLSGLGTLFFEVGLLCFLFIPYLRFVPILIGISFHFLTAFFMEIYFWGLLTCYAMFVDWNMLIRKMYKGTKLQAIEPQLHLSPSLGLMALVIIFLQMFTGISHCREAWPISCYPTFRKLQGPMKDVIEVQLLTSNGETVYRGILGQKPQKHSKTIRMMMDKILAVKDPESKNEKLRLFLSIVYPIYTKDEPMLLAKIYKSKVGLFPEEWKKEPVKRELIYEIQL